MNKMHILKRVCLYLLFSGLFFATFKIASTFGDTDKDTVVFDQKSICVTFKNPASYKKTQKNGWFELRENQNRLSGITVNPCLPIEPTNDKNLLRAVAKLCSPAEYKGVSKLRETYEQSFKISGREAFMITWKFRQGNSDYVQTNVLIYTCNEKIDNGYLGVFIISEATDKKQHNKLVDMILKSMKFR